MTAKCRQATRRQSRLTWCTEVIAVSAVVTDTAVDTGRTKASIGMAISTAPNPAALRTANAPIVTSMKKTTPSRDKDDTLRISRPSAPLGAMFSPGRAGRNEIQPGLRARPRIGQRRCSTALGQVLPFTTVSSWSRIASLFAACGEWPADPVAQGFAHHEFEVTALQPRQLLGEQGHALPPGAQKPERGIGVRIAPVYPTNRHNPVGRNVR